MTTPVLERPASMGELIGWHPHLRIDKFDPDQVRAITDRIGREPTVVDFRRLRIRPSEVTDLDGNLLLTQGLDRLTKLIIASGSPVALTLTTGRIGVGDSTTAAAVGQTDLQALAGSTHRQFEVLTSLTQANGLITMQASFSSGEANYTWNEWGFDIGTATVTAGTTVNTLINRLVANAGTKALGSVWAPTATLTIA